MLKFKSPPTPKKQRITDWTSPSLTELSLSISHLAAQQFILLITPDTQTAERLAQEIRFFGNHAQLFVDWETLPYDQFSPHQAVTSQRLATLYQLAAQTQGVLVVPITTLMQRVCPTTFIHAHALILKTGQRLDREGFRLRLEAAGYSAVSQVVAHGEFTVRGALLDLFPMGLDYPIRIDLFDDEIESIRRFDPDTQLTQETLTHVELLPAREFPLTKDAISLFRQNFRHTFEVDPNRSPIYQSVSDGHAPAGIEFYFPLFFQETATLFDYLPTHTTIITLPQAEAAASQFSELIAGRFESYRHDTERPLLPPDQLYLSVADIAERKQTYARIQLQIDQTSHAIALPSIAMLNHFTRTFKSPILLTVDSAGRREALLEQLRAHDLSPQTLTNWSDFTEQTPDLAIIIAPFAQGFVHQQPHFAVITQTELIGEKPLSRRRKATTRDPAAILQDLTDLALGDALVHLQHGVGRYEGLQTLTDDHQHSTEFVVIAYAGGGKLYVPVAHLDLLSRYTGASAEHAPWHTLGSDKWDKAKRKAAEKVRDAAAELLDLYAQREVREAHEFVIEEADYQRFANSFPFEETPDQQLAIAAVKTDMLAGKMDRVICGDVGFGKTEVAMRAAFLAVQAGYQVAVLAPTTLLAEQHHDNFKDRFANWPFKIASLSRFKSAAESKQVIAELINGQIDIVIGTHKLLSEEVVFKQLGLVVIDEEHRFGVRQKERLKTLRAQVDILTLTATPIPRTLNMGLSGIKALSIIATPPEGRLSVKTFINQWHEPLIQEAVAREFKRGGQVYFLHNDVASIERMAQTLQALCPNSAVAIAHGQMRERDLEKVMLDFYHQRINLLVCSTIIESGIDVPTANTILINRADKLGLAQLHQLRGRVGRSHHRAYCYLITPPKKQMTADAVKRVEAIESLEELGSGFMLANHDLEIRGAGELLGESQSGQIHEIGFNLYMDLLSRAVTAIKAGNQPELETNLQQGVEINLSSPALIPDDYLPDVHLRLTLYKRIASSVSSDDLRQLQVEMIDRFGLLPDAAKTLFKSAEIKLQAQPLCLKKIEADKQGVRIVFGDKPQLNPAKLIDLLQKQPHLYQLNGQESLKYRLPLEHLDARILAVQRLLNQLT